MKWQRTRTRSRLEAYRWASRHEPCSPNEDEYRSRFRHYHTDDELRRYRSLSAEQKLAWSHPAWKLTVDFLPANSRRAHERLRHGDGDDIIDGGPGDDFTLDGGSGQDTIRGGPGIESEIAGRDGDDRLFADEGGAFMFGGSGQDILIGSSDGGDGDDFLGSNVPGEPGDDVLIGGAGNDFLTDCVNHNQLNGGAGTDTCNFDPSQSSAVSCEATAFPCN